MVEVAHQPLTRLCRFEEKPDWWSGFPVFLSKPGKSPRCGLDFGKFRDDAKLLHKAKGIPVHKAFHHLSASKPSDGYARDGKLLPRWRDSVQLTIMFSPAGPPSDYGFAFGDDVLDRQPHVGERRAGVRYSLLLALRASPNIVCRGVMVRVARSNAFICHPQIALVPKFIKQTTDSSFVLF